MTEPLGLVPPPPVRYPPRFEGLSEIASPCIGPPVNLTVSQLAEWVSGELLGDGDVRVSAARPLSEAGTDDITFVEGERQAAAWSRCRAAAAVVGDGIKLNGRPLIRVKDPMMAFAEILRRLRGDAPAEPGGPIDPSARVHSSVLLTADVSVGPFAVIGEGAVLGARCRLYPGVVIGRGCRLGDDVILHPRVVLYDGCVIGNRVTIHANAVIGGDGFGYRMQNGRHVKVPQLGRVEVGDDVEIGAGTTIDRGTFGSTRIGAGTKIDNMVMIGHNCQIGRHNLLCAQVGIAGSTTTGDYVVMAGQVGVADHLHIADQTVVGPQTGVIRDTEPGSRVMSGLPARPDKEHWRIITATSKLPVLLRDVRRIKKLLGLGGGE